MRINKTVVDGVEPPAKGQAFYRDDLLKGFALRVTSTGTKSFVVEVRVGGKTRRKTLGRYGRLTVEQARKQAQQYLGQIAGGTDPVAEERAQRASRVTLGEAFDAYLKVRKGLKPRTVEDYRDLMNKSLGDWLDRPLASISKDAVAKRHEHLGEKSHARANNAMRVLRAVFNFARHQYENADGHSLFPENPVSRLSHTRAWYHVGRRRSVLRSSQLPAWFAAVEARRTPEADPDDRLVADLLVLLLLTGLRRSEGLALRWEQIDLQARTLHIHDTKNSEPLELPLSDYLADLFTARRELAPGPFVFPGRGESGHLHTPQKGVRRVVEASGVEFTLHDLRRTFITVAESLDVPVYAIKRLVNHKMPNDVTAGYVVIDTERLREPMQRITDRLLTLGEVRKDPVVVPFEREARA